MSSNTDPDSQLRQFLRAYHPPMPPPSPSLESQLFQRIDQQSPRTLAVVNPQSPNRRWLALGLALVGMAIGGGATWRWQTQTAVKPTSPEVLEAFLADSWTGAIAVTEEAPGAEIPQELSSPSQEWWQLTQSTAATLGNK